MKRTGKAAGKRNPDKIGSGITEQIGYWLKLARIEHAFMVYVAILIAEALTWASISFSPFELGWRNFYSALGPFFITAAAFILNDYFGFETDKANKRFDRPIVAGKIEKKDALKAAYLLYAIGLLLSFFVNWYCFIVAFVFAFLSAIYDNYLKKQPLLGNLYIAGSMSAAFIYGNFLYTNELQSTISTLILVSFLAGVGREFLITLRDVKGDKKIGAKTLPMMIGSKATIMLSAIMFLIAMLFSWIYVKGNATSTYAILIYINNLLLIGSIYFAQKNEFGKVRNLSLYALLVGIIAFATLAL